MFGHRFDEVRLRLERLPEVRRFKPIVREDQRISPHMVFVNSLSDFWHEQIPDAAIDQMLDVMEQAPQVIFQILTKRPVRARRKLGERYGGGRLPRNFWIGVSTEDNRVAPRLNVLRRIRESCGNDATYFASTEPIVGPTDELNFAGIDWVITGGESGPHARLMERRWLLGAIVAAQVAGAAIWHKQSGQLRSHPNYHEAPRSMTQRAQMQWLVDNGWEFLPGEKGGATVDRRTFRALPAGFYTVKTAMQPGGNL